VDGALGKEGVMRTLGPKELLEDVFQRSLCVGCGACVELCPYFKTHRGRTSMLFPCNLQTGRCYAHCPKAEVDLDALSRWRWGKPYTLDPLGSYRDHLVARAGKRVPQGGFQAGGTVTALMAFAMEKGMIDCAVLTDREGLTPVPRLATDVEGVLRCASSKYTAAPTLAGFNRAVREGYGRIGVVGTPCQTLALTQMRANPLDRPGFSDPVALTVGLFCTWALDTRAFMALASKYVDVRKLRKMDIPPPPAGELLIETDEQEIRIPLEEVRPLVPEGCLICPDMSSEWADVSVGVLEGEPQWNTVLVRTELGSQILEKAIAEGWLETREMPGENLAHLQVAARNKKKRAFHRVVERGLVNTVKNGGRSALRIDPKSLENILHEREG
jgi:coenzyme F420 hydrogenase subunit beta